MKNSKIPMTGVYLGSSADDSIGVGTILKGTAYRNTDEGYELQLEDGRWIEVYDVIKVYGWNTTIEGIMS